MIFKSLSVCVIIRIYLIAICNTFNRILKRHLYNRIKSFFSLRIYVGEDFVCTNRVAMNKYDRLQRLLLATFFILVYDTRWNRHALYFSDFNSYIHVLNQSRYLSFFSTHVCSSKCDVLSYLNFWWKRTVISWEQNY